MYFLIQDDENIENLPNSSAAANLEEMDRRAVKDDALNVSITTAEKQTKF